MDFEKMVEKILAPYKFVDDLQPITGQSLRSDILTALRAAATVPEGMVRVGTEDMRLLGTLPVTDDGCVIGEGATVWRVYENWRDGLGISSIKAYIDWYEPDRPEKYADPENASKKLKEVQEQNDRIKRQAAAAEAARPKGGEG